MVLRHKLNDVLETEMQMFPFPSRKKKFQLFGIWKRKCVSWKHVSVSIKKTCFSFDRGWKRKRVAFSFPFPRNKNRLQLPYSLSVVNSANDDPAKTKRVKRPVAELSGSIDPRVKKNVSVCLVKKY